MAREFPYWALKAHPAGGYNAAHGGSALQNNAGGSFNTAVDPDLVVRDEHHGVYTVRYETVNAMLLNEFQKEHRKVEPQNSQIQALQQRAGKVDSLERRLADLERGVRSLADRK